MASTTTSTGGNVSATITNDASNVSRSGNTVSATVKATWKQTSSWTANSVKCWIPAGGTAYTLFNSNSGANHTSSSSTYSASKDCSWTVNAGDSSLTYEVGFGWNGWSPSQGVKLANTITFSKGSYTVAYNANGGSSTPSTQTVTVGNSCTLASAISHANTSSDSNATITVSYNANGGSSTPSNGTGTAVNTTTTTYTFSKWALGSTSGTKYSAGASFTPSGNSTMYATWTTSDSTSRKSNPSITTAGSILRSNSTGSQYTVSYNANGGSSTPSSQTATKTRSYSFSKWNTNSSGTGTDYNASTAYTFSANTTLYAKWTYSDSGGAITLASSISRANGATAGYAITYNANGGSGAPGNQTSGNRTITYTFNKWAAGSTSGTQYSASSSYTPSADITMYALWNSSTSNNSSWTVSSVVPTRTGYTFLGWSENQNATTADYTSNSTYTITSGKTLYAVWQINYYYLDLNGYLDNAYISNIATYGKCDVYINGVKDATQVTDYYKQWPYGTQYEFKNITSDWGCKYDGVNSGTLSGTIGAGNVSTRLTFHRFPVTLQANKDGQWYTGIMWINDNGTWVKAKALHIRHEDDWERLEKIDFTL